MKTLYINGTNLINLPFCHSFQILSQNPNVPFFVSFPSKQIPKLTSKPYSISFKKSHFSPIQASMASSTVTDTNKPFSVLFVCLGNICRSPAAEGVFTDLVKKSGFDSKFRIDSAGTINYHEGNQADSRMRAASKRRGIEITSISRPIKSSDFVEFDLILAMDKQNREDILEAFNRWKFRDPLPEDAHKKVKLMCSYCKKHDETEVPDPYYGGPQGFEKVLDMLEDACQSLLENILAENKHIQES
ncbi:putative low molecular weight protein-tyrosine-phosphatase [Trifolium repens]|nr:putative low molecular weight protein-tyrosine-phosphatase [Trifolium repens]